jgi:hypothetical protein
MESHYGADFSRVRVHVGQRPADAARAMGASAYTLGRDVVFAEGEYEPGTEAGDRLIAHELTHVLQQSPGGSPARSGPAAEGAGAPENETEAEAERNAEAVSRGGRAEVRQAAAADAPQFYPARPAVHALEVHEGPDDGSRVLFTLRRGQLFEVVEVVNGWQRISVPRGRTMVEGFVRTTRDVLPLWSLPAAVSPLLLAPPRAPSHGPTPYPARTTRRYASIRYAPPAPSLAVQTPTVAPAEVFNFQGQMDIFVTVLEDPGGDWVRVRHGEREGWMRRTDLAPVTRNGPADVERSTTHHLAVSESSDRAGHYTRDMSRDNVGLGSWTQGRIVSLMERYRAVFSHYRQEESLYSLFGGRRRFDDIQNRLRSSRAPTVVLTPEEGRLFEAAGRHPLIRQAEEEQLHEDFTHYVPDPAVLRPFYPWVGDDDTISEMALAMFVSMRHRGESNERWQWAFGRTLGDYRRHPENFRAGEADFLREVGRRLSLDGRGESNGSIRNRYFNVVSTFRESPRRFSIRRAPAAGGANSANTPSAATPTRTAPTSARPR